MGLYELRLGSLEPLRCRGARGSEKGDLGISIRAQIRVTRRCPHEPAPIPRFTEVLLGRCAGQAQFACVIHFSHVQVEVKGLARGHEGA